MRSKRLLYRPYIIHLALCAGFNPIIECLTKIYNNKSYWEGIKGVRNRLIHEYWGTSIQMIYEISVDEMDELLDYIKQIRELEKSQIS